MIKLSHRLYKYGWLNAGLLGVLAGGLIYGCDSHQNPGESAEVESVIEPSAWYASKVATKAGNATALEIAKVTNAWDVRGVGDSAWTHGGAAGNRPKTPLAPNFGDALRAVDPGAVRLKGHLSFINWESVVGTRCDTINNGVDFYFLSHPNAIRQAVDFGFNMISLANNHARDCMAPYGPDLSAANLTAIAKEKNILWHGTGDTFQRATIKTIVMNGKPVKVAFGALTIVSWEMKKTAQIILPNEGIEKVRPLLTSLQSADVDLRILSIHTQDSSGHNKNEAAAIRMLKSVGESFIKNFNGNIVLGHGPHTAAGVKVVPRSDGRTGAIVVSMGNFIHNGVSSQVDNYAARVLVSPTTKSISEIQIMPFRNVPGPTISWSTPASAKRPAANFVWNTDAAKKIFYAKF
jgi:hypothetical protein